MNYRPEVDGLRAIAIVPVLFFHAGFQFFHGGFLGVDIFFVISGYLITSILLTEHLADNFSITRFYERRIRRIMPALFLVMFCSLLAAWWIMPPSILKEYSHSLGAVILFISNFYFIFKSGYFDTDVDLNPMLHTWSLAVEEQYYVVFPLLVAILWRFRVRFQLAALVILLLGSIFLANELSATNANASFYLPFTRAWELLFGALVAYAHVHGKYKLFQKDGWSQLLSIVGVVLLILSFTFINKETSHPSFITLMPVLGTALILQFADGSTVVGRMLANSWLVFVGLISYPLYLWHQPIFAFLRLQAVESPGAMHYAIGILVSLGLAWLTTHYVERFTRSKQHFSRKQIFAGAGVSSLLVVVLCLAIHYTDGFSQRTGKLAVTFGGIDRQPECFNLNAAHEPETDKWGCDINAAAGNRIAFMAVGDSHNLSLLPAFEWMAKEANVRGFFTGYQGCPPLLGVYLVNRKDQFAQECFALNEKIARFAKLNHVQDVYLVARWTYYTDGDYTSGRLRYIGLQPETKATMENSRLAFSEAINKTAALYQQMGIRLHVVRQVPMQYVDAKNIYWKAASNDSQQLNKNLLALSVEQSRFDQFMTFNDSAWKTNHYIDYVDFSPLFCQSGKCLVGTADESYYSDSNHLTTAGALLLKEALHGNYLKAIGDVN